MRNSKIRKSCYDNENNQKYKYFLDQYGSFEYVPDKYKTLEMCLYACKKDGKNIKYVHNNFKNDNYYKILLKINIYCFKYLKQ
jgi:hypothetical protein